MLYATPGLIAASDDYQTLSCPGAEVVTLVVMDADVVVGYGQGFPFPVYSPNDEYKPVGRDNIAQSCDEVRFRNAAPGKTARIAISTRGVSDRPKDKAIPGAQGLPGADGIPRLIAGADGIPKSPGSYLSFTGKGVKVTPVSVPPNPTITRTVINVPQNGLIGAGGYFFQGPLGTGVVKAPIRNDGGTMVTRGNGILLCEHSATAMAFGAGLIAVKVRHFLTGLEVGSAFLDLVAPAINTHYTLPWAPVTYDLRGVAIGSAIQTVVENSGNTNTDAGDFFYSRFMEYGEYV